MRRLGLLAASCLLLPCVVASAADPPVVTLEHNAVTISTSSPIRVTYGPGYVRLSFQDDAAPAPVPPAPPAPVPVQALTGKLFLSYIVPAAATQEQTVLRESLVAQSLGDRVVCRTYVAIEAEPMRLGLLLEGRTPPYLAIQHQPDGAAAGAVCPVIRVLDDPKSVDEVRAAILKLRGK